MCVHVEGVPKVLFFFLPIKREGLHSVVYALKCLQNVMTLTHSLTLSHTGSGKNKKNRSHSSGARVWCLLLWGCRVPVCSSRVSW